MADFTFNLYYKYWPAPKKDWAFLKTTVLAEMALRGGTALDVTFEDVPMHRVRNPEGAKLVVTVTGADRIDSELTHDRIADVLQLHR